MAGLYGPSAAVSPQPAVQPAIAASYNPIVSASASRTPDIGLPGSIDASGFPPVLMLLAALAAVFTMSNQDAGPGRPASNFSGGFQLPRPSGFATAGGGEAGTVAGNAGGAGGSAASSIVDPAILGLGGVGNSGNS